MNISTHLFHYLNNVIITTHRTYQQPKQVLTADRQNNNESSFCEYKYTFDMHQFISSSIKSLNNTGTKGTDCIWHITKES